MAAEKAKVMFEVELAQNEKLDMLDVGYVYLDIETRKVPAPEGFPVKSRWQAFMVGLGYAFGKVEGGAPDRLRVEVLASEDENALLAAVTERLRKFGPTVVYAATREFDKAVLGGTFVTARKPHLPAPAYPHIPVEEFEWENIRKGVRLVSIERDPADLPSKEVPEAWARGERWRVALHCGRDVMELMLADPGAVLPANVQETFRMLLTLPLGDGSGNNLL